jgi:hypothetical protein
MRSASFAARGISLTLYAILCAHVPLEFVYGFAFTALTLLLRLSDCPLDIEELVLTHFISFEVEKECDRLFHDRIRAVELATPDLFADPLDRFGFERDLHDLPLF